MLNLNILKQEIFAEHNKIRKNPKSYIPILEKQLQYFKGSVLYKPGEIGIQTNEGPAAYKECIKFLNSQKPLPEIQLNECLSKAAQDHANDIGKNGMTDHIGSDGSNPADRIERYLVWDVTVAENLDFGSKTGEDVIVSLIVDDGVTNRGHRTNIFKNDIKFVGIGLAKHNSDYEVCTTLAYVGDITEEKVKGKSANLETIKVKKPVDQKPQATTNTITITTTTTTTSTVPKGGAAPQATQATKNDRNASKSPKKKKDKVKKENFFGPIVTPYNLNDDEDKPKGAVDCKVKIVTRKANGYVTKFTTKTYKMKDGKEVVLEIEERNE